MAARPERIGEMLKPDRDGISALVTGLILAFIIGLAIGLPIGAYIGLPE